MQRTPTSGESQPPATAEASERLGEMLERQLPAVRRFVHRKMGTKLRMQESASDIVQSVCREVLQDVDPEAQLDRGEDELRQWLLLTAARKLVNRARYNQAEKRRPDGELLSLDSPAAAQPPAETGSVNARPESAAQLGEEMDRLQAALLSLPDEYRRVFEWRHVHGCSRVEIAEHLGKTPNAVSKLLARATAKLARELREKSSRPKTADGIS